MPLILADIQARLGDMGRFCFVDGVVELATARKANPQNVPAAYVYHLDDIASANASGPNGVSQEVSENFGVVLAVRNVLDATGAAAGVELREHVHAVLAELVGWKPAGCEQLIEFRGGGLDAFPDTYLWWLMKFSTGYTLYKY